MKRMLAWLAAITVTTLSFAACAATPYGTTAEAEALVKKAVAYYQKNGRDKAIEEFRKSPGPFVDRDLYVTVYDMKGDALAHINPKMVGRNMMDLRDTDGTYIIRDRTAAAQKADSGWQDIKFYNPVTKKVEPKRVFWHKYDNLIFAAGAYKPQ